MEDALLGCRPLGHSFTPRSLWWTVCWRWLPPPFLRSLPVTWGLEEGFLLQPFPCHSITAFPPHWIPDWIPACCLPSVWWLNDHLPCFAVFLYRQFNFGFDFHIVLFPVWSPNLLISVRMPLPPNPLFISSLIAFHPFVYTGIHSYYFLSLLGQWSFWFTPPRPSSWAAFV